MMSFAAFVMTTGSGSESTIERETVALLAEPIRPTARESSSGDEPRERPDWRASRARATSSSIAPSITPSTSTTPAGAAPSRRVGSFEKCDGR